MGLLSFHVCRSAIHHSLLPIHHSPSVSTVVKLNQSLYAILFIALLCPPAGGKLVAQTDNPYHINGNATQENCNCYTLTKDQTGQSGSVWNINKIDLTRSFDFHFNVFLGCRDAEGADGIAFVLQPISTSIGTTGEGLGVEGVSPSVIIAIDTWQNENKGDPAYDNVSIHLNGDLGHNTTNNIAGPVAALANSDNIEDCQWHVFRIWWDAASKKITVFMDGVERLAATIDLVESVFQQDPMVFWGFTGATGGSTNHQRFCTSLNASFSFPEGQTTCYPEPVNFRDSSTSFGNIVKWFWDFGDGTTDTVENPGAHIYPQPGNYTVKLNILGNNGCLSDTFQQKVVAGSIPVAAFDMKDAPYCDNRSVTIGSTSYVEFGAISEWNWTVDGNTTRYRDTSLSALFSTGTHHVSLLVKTREGCVSDRTEQTLEIKPHPSVSLQARTVACRDEMLAFNASDLSPAIPVSGWRWDFGDGNTAALQSPGHAYADTGHYMIKAYGIAVNGCPSDTVARSITVYGTNAYAGTDTTIAMGQALQLNGSGGDYYSWSPAAGLSNVAIANPVAILQGDIKYVLTVTSDAGCPSTDTIAVKVYKGPEFYVPSAFTPDGDGLNDVFRFVPVGMTQIAYFRIFDRYGQMVYSSADPRQGWEGTVNGKAQAANTYVWTIAGKDYLGNTVQRKGVVTLIR
jgi:gliding motility-associated-like protein